MDLYALSRVPRGSCSSEGVTEPIALIRQLHVSYSEAAEAAERSGPSSVAAQRRASVLIRLLSQSLHAPASTYDGLTPACAATGILLALQAWGSEQRPLTAALRGLYTDAIGALSRVAQPSPPFAVWLAQASKHTDHVTAGVACSCLLTSAWASQCESQPGEQRRVSALVAGALVRVQRAPTAIEGTAALRAALQVHARSVAAAFSATIQSAATMTALQVPLCATLVTALQASCMSGGEHDASGDGAARSLPAHKQQLLVPLLWQILHAARRLGHAASGDQPSERQHKPFAETILLHCLTADSLLVCSLVYDATTAQHVPQLSSLLASAQAALQGSSAAALQLIQRVPVPRDMPGVVSVNHNYLPALRTQPFSPRSSVALTNSVENIATSRNIAEQQHAGTHTQDSIIVQLPEVAGGHSVRMQAVRWAACASFLLVFAAPSLPAAASGTEHANSLQACAAAAAPILYGLIRSRDAAAQSAGADFLLALVAAAPPDAQWADSLVLRWMRVLAAQYPDTVQSEALQSAVHGLLGVQLRPEVLLACCQVLTDRAHTLLDRQRGHGQAGVHHGASAVDGLVGCLMVVLVWANVSVLTAVLGMLEGVWQKATGAQARGVSKTIMQHLLQCHDHRKKPHCVRWYHQQLQRSSWASL
jgi:hypothetical protein